MRTWAAMRRMSNRAHRPPFRRRTGESQWHGQLHKAACVRDLAESRRNATVVELSAVCRSCSARMTGVYGGEASVGAPLRLPRVSSGGYRNRVAQISSSNCSFQPPSLTFRHSAIGSRRQTEGPTGEPIQITGFVDKQSSIDPI